jgi:hypothetical protein
VSNTYRVPLVVIGSPKYVKSHHLSHVAYTTSNVIAAMERVMENVKPGIISRSGSLGRSTFPMTTSDQKALGDPLEDFWVQRGRRHAAAGSTSPMTGNSSPVTTSTRLVPGTPLAVAATAAKGKIILSWHDPSRTGEKDVTAYEIFRGTSSGTETYVTSGGCANPGAALTCSDSGLERETRYFYYVVASNSIAAGPQSKEVSARP